MIIGSSDRAAVEALQHVCRNHPGLVELLERLTLRREIAYEPGCPFDHVAYRCGMQAAGKIILEVALQPVDWEALRQVENRIAEAQKQQQMESEVYNE